MTDDGRRLDLRRGRGRRRMQRLGNGAHAFPLSQLCKWIAGILVSRTPSHGLYFWLKVH